MKTIEIRNGEKFVHFFIYICQKCGKKLPECDPLISINDEKYCPDCAFLAGLISEERCKKVGYYWLGCPDKFYLKILNGEVVPIVGKFSERPEDRRNSPKYQRWRDSVFSRDKYTCQSCGQVGGELNAHHILPYKTHKKLRLDINNGKTLCVHCHKAAHYGEKQ